MQESSSTIPEYLPLNRFARLAQTNRTTLKQQVERGLEKNGSGEARVRVAEFIAHMRQETEPQPLQIQIVNAKDIGSVAKVLTVKRDDTGKLSGAVSQPIS